MGLKSGPVTIEKGLKGTVSESEFDGNERAEKRFARSVGQ
jgi:hypothetical protein